MIVNANDTLEDLHIIDWHVHIAGLGYGNSGAFINDEMRNNYRFRFFMRWMDVTLKELETHGDQIVVKKLNDKIKLSTYIDEAIVLAMDGVIDPNSKQLDKGSTQFYVPNEHVATETAKYPGLLFGASINPNREDSIKRLVKVHQQGAYLIKWIPSIMYIDMYGICKVIRRTYNIAAPGYIRSPIICPSTTYENISVFRNGMRIRQKR